MVGSNGTMMAIRIVRSKLRKREDSVHPVDVVVSPTQPQQCTPVTPAPTQEPVAFRPPVWQFPPPLPPPYVYTNDQDTLMPNIGNESPGFRKLRKSISGRLRRIVNKKPEQEIYTIPPELKPQLKQIYVY